MPRYVPSVERLPLQRTLQHTRKKGVIKSANVMARYAFAGYVVKASSRIGGVLAIRRFCFKSQMPVTTQWQSRAPLR
jgi:hypothetical protein